MQLSQTRQQDDENLTAYYKRFISLVEKVERTYGDITPVKTAEKNPGYNKGKQQTIDSERDKMLAYRFMDGANQGFVPLLRDMENDYLLGHAKFPETIEEALQVLTLYTE